MVQWISAVVALIVFVGGLVTYSFQKKKDRKEDIIKTRRSEYRRWIQAFYDASAGNVDGAIEINKATNDLFLFASEDVILSVGTLKQYMATTSPGGAPRDMIQVGRLVAAVVLSMRRDCFEETKLTQDEIRRILPIQGVRDDDAPSGSEGSLPAT